MVSSPTNPTESANIGKLHETTLDWSSLWGGVAYWPISLYREYGEAASAGQIKTWMKLVIDHASCGRSLLRQLSEFNPACHQLEAYQEKEIWRINVEMIVLLAKGITILEGLYGSSLSKWRASLSHQFLSQDRGQSEIGNNLTEGERSGMSKEFEVYDEIDVEDFGDEDHGSSVNKNTTSSEDDSTDGETSCCSLEV